MCQQRIHELEEDTRNKNHVDQAAYSMLKMLLKEMEKQSDTDDQNIVGEAYLH
jgi:hypothetical protein